MPPWQSWGQSSWNNWRDDKNKYQYDSEEALQFPEVETPNSWKSTNTFYDENVSFGLQFHRTIQPTSWSRKRGLTGLDPLKVPIGLLTRHGASEFGLRTLSNGRFFGIISCRNVPETVFGSQLFRAIREAQIDLDSIAESLHRKLDPKGVVPSKTEKPSVFVEPLIQKIVDLLKDLQPERAESSAVRKLQSVQAELEAAQAKLKEAGLTPQDPDSQNVDFVPEEESDETSKAVLPTKRKTPPSLILGASPKKKVRQAEAEPAGTRSLDKVFKAQQQQAAKGSPPGSKHPFLGHTWLLVVRSVWRPYFFCEGQFL